MRCCKDTCIRLCRYFNTYGEMENVSIKHTLFHVALGRSAFHSASAAGFTDGGTV